MNRTADPAMETEDLPALLAREHERLNALFADVADAFEAGNAEAAAQLFTVLEASLEAHFALEEEHVLPVLARVDENEATALRREHDALRARITELAIGVDLHATRAHAVRQLVESLRAHAAREGTLAYRCAEANLEGSVRERLAEAVRERLARLSAIALPRRH